MPAPQAIVHQPRAWQQVVELVAWAEDHLEEGSGHPLPGGEDGPSAARQRSTAQPDQPSTEYRTYSTSSSCSPGPGLFHPYDHNDPLAIGRHWKNSQRGDVYTCDPYYLPCTAAETSQRTSPSGRTDAT